MNNSQTTTEQPPKQPEVDSPAPSLSDQLALSVLAEGMRNIQDHRSKTQEDFQILRNSILHPSKKAQLVNALTEKVLAKIELS